VKMIKFNLVRKTPLIGTLFIKSLIGILQRIVFLKSWLKSGSFWRRLSLLTKEKYIVLKI